MSSSVDGLVSGLSTSSLIGQLMQVEAAPQNRLKAKVQTAENTVASYTSVNGKLFSLKGAADTLGQLSTWRSIQASSSSSGVVATATGGTNSASGVTTFDVVSVATAQVGTVQFPKDTADGTDGSTELSFEFGTPPAGTPIKVEIGADKSPAAIASAINSTKGLPVRAGVVTTSTGDVILQLSSTKSGTDNAFSVTGLSTSPITVIAPADAMIRVGSLDTTDPMNPTLTPGSYEVKSSSNTFTGLLPGVSVTITKPETGVTVTAQADVAGIAEKLQALVDAANAALDEVSAQTAYDPTTRKGSALTGDFMVRQLSHTIMSSVSGGLSYANPKYVKPADGSGLPEESPGNMKLNVFGSLAQVGIQLDRGGKLTFNAGKFTTAYNADPTKIQEAMIGLADNFEEQTSKQSLVVTKVITGRRLEIDNFKSQISNWDIRLAARQLTLQKQYTNLETALGNLKNKSNWLAGQLGGMSG
ncbi:flagellar filament capping protein FliD [Actinoplanes sp. GCM10030250]|uniref:flagellar filament capping protein FliD n=1 Tax=Actinoplanes sp. GCM10030250 TaxID=3273376 RepID=UPI00360C9E10